MRIGDHPVNHGRFLVEIGQSEVERLAQGYALTSENSLPSPIGKVVVQTREGTPPKDLTTETIDRPSLTTYVFCSPHTDSDSLRLRLEQGFGANESVKSDAPLDFLVYDDTRKVIVLPSKGAAHHWYAGDKRQ